MNESKAPWITQRGIAFLVIGLVIGAIAGYALSLPETSRLQSELNSVQSDLSAAQNSLGELQSKLAPPTLPEGAVQLSELIPGMGEHWAVPLNLPLGPIYLVHDDEVIGIEFVFTLEMMENVTIPGPEGNGFFLQLAGLSVNTFVDHVDVEFLPLGRPGFEVPHYSVHIYFISQEERQELVPHEH